MLQVDDVDEAAVSPSKCNKEEERTVSLQIDKSNVLVYLYGNAATQAFTRLLLLLLFFYFLYHNSLCGFDWPHEEQREGDRKSIV